MTPTRHVTMRWSTHDVVGSNFTLYREMAGYVGSALDYIK